MLATTDAILGFIPRCSGAGCDTSAPMIIIGLFSMLGLHELAKTWLTPPSFELILRQRFPMTCLLSSPRLKRFCLRQHWVVMLSFMSPTCLILSYMIPALKGRTIMTKSVAFPMLENLSLILTRKFSIFCRPSSWFLILALMIKTDCPLEQRCNEDLKILEEHSV